MADRIGTNGWYKLRWQILERDEFTCQYCGQHAPDVKLEVDHRIALADGGTNDDSNLITSCWACNRGKSGLRQSIVLRKLRSDVKIEELPKRQERIRDLISANPGLKAKEIAKLENTTIGCICMACMRLVKAGKIKRTGKQYFISSP